MNIYWTLKQIPELRDLSKDQRMRVCRACSSSDYKFKMIHLLVLLAVMVPGFWLFSKAPTTTAAVLLALSLCITSSILLQVDRKSTRLNSSHRCISYAV